MGMHAGAGQARAVRGGIRRVHFECRTRTQGSPQLLPPPPPAGSAETEYYYMLAANQIQRPFVRCIVVGDSNRSVEAAHELGMKSVVVTGARQRGGAR